MNRGVGLAAVAALGTSACAGTITFESVPSTLEVGTHTSLTLADGSGVSATFTRTSAAAPSFGRFDVVNLLANPVGWGNRHLSPFYGQTTTPASDAFLANLSAPGRVVRGISIEFGDFGADSGNARLQAWSGPNGTGTLLFDGFKFWGGNLGTGSAPSSLGFLNMSASIGSVKFWGEQGTYVNSLYWDNLGITSEAVIPLPQAGGMAMAGLGILFARRRRLRVV